MDVVAVGKEIMVRHSKEMAVELVDALLLQALSDAAAKSENKIDDLLLATLGPNLVVALKDLIAKA